MSQSQLNQQPPGASSQYQQQPPGGAIQPQPSTGGLQQGAVGSAGGQQRTGTQGGQIPGGGTTRQSLLFPTQNYLPRDVRVPIAETLNRVLADTTILRTQVKFAHWNVKGSDFYGLHELFDEIAEDLEEHADEVAERIAALGAQAMGTAGMAVENCSVPPMPSDAVTGMEYVELLADRLAIHDANLHEAIGTAQTYGDLDTADLLNEVSREVSQQLWFLEAHLQTQPVGTVQLTGSPQAGGGQPRGGQGIGGTGAVGPTGTGGVVGQQAGDQQSPGQAGQGFPTG